MIFLAIVQVNALGQPIYRTNSHPENIQSKNPAVLSIIKKALEIEDSGDLNGAIELHKEILDIEPDNILSANTIAGLYGKLSRFDQEVIWAKKAISINPKFGLAYINYGNGLAGLNKPDEAEAAFKKAGILYPSSPLAPYSLGVLAEDQKNFVEAVNYYKESIELDSHFENGYFNLAVAYANMKQYEKAKVQLKALIKINPKAADAKEMLDSLDH